MGGKLSKKKKGYDVSDHKDLKDEITATAVSAVESVQAAVESALPAEAAGVTAEVGKKASAVVEEVVGSALAEVTQAVEGVMGTGGSKEAEAAPKEEPAPAQEDLGQLAAVEMAAVEPAPIPEISVMEPGPVEKDAEPEAEAPAAVEVAAVEPTPVPEMHLEESAPVEKDPEPAVEEQVAIKHVAVEPAADEPAAVEPAAVEPAAVEPVAVELSAKEPTPVQEISVEAPAPVTEPAAVETAAVETPPAVEPVVVEQFAEEPAIEEPAPVQKSPELTPLEAAEATKGDAPEEVPAQTQETPVPVLEPSMAAPPALTPVEPSLVEQPEPENAKSLVEDCPPAPEPHMVEPEADTEMPEAQAPRVMVETVSETVEKTAATELQSEPTTNLEVSTEVPTNAAPVPVLEPQAVEELGVAEVQLETAAPVACITKPEPVTEEPVTTVSPDPEAPEAIVEEAVVLEAMAEDSAVEEELIPEPPMETKMENGDTKSPPAVDEVLELDSPPAVNGGCSDSSVLSEEQVNGVEAEPEVKAAIELRESEVTKDLTFNAPEDVSEMVKSISAADNQAVELV